jgi:hypothetical protein
MKAFVKLFLVFSLLFFCGNAIAQTDLAGTWQGKLATSSNEQLTIQFTITKQSDGSYKAVLNSPDTGGIKNVAANSVKFAAGKLSLDVASLSGSYTGTLAKGTITGEWKQQGSTIPLVLTPYKKPAVGTLKPLLGEWVGKLTPPGAGEITAVFRFEMAKDGSFVGFADVPEQNAKGIPISDITLAGNQLTFKIPAAQADYAGKLTGNSVDGTLKQAGAQFDLDLTKGKYQPPPIDIPVESQNKLLGKWAGKMDVQDDAAYTIILRFEKTKDGKFYAYTDSPEQGGYGNRLTDVVLKGDQFSFKLPLTNGKYTGKLVDNTITGTYEVSGKQYTLNVTRGAKFEAPVTQADIPADVMKKLLGRWNGTLATLSVTFRFEQNAAGKSIIAMDIPNQNVKGMTALKASLANDKLSLKFFGGREYSGKLSGNKIDGAWMQSGQNVPLILTKE